MPSHIFTRLGMWDESIAANRASAEASRAYAAMRHRDATEAEELHALDYMAYSYLQEAQDAEAKKIVDLAAKVRKTNPELEFSAAYALAAIPTRYAFERNDWAAAANIGRFQTCHTGLRSHSWKLSSNMVTRSDARTPATSTAREKQSRECSNYATRRKIQSSTISKVISTCRCKRLRLGWPQLKARKNEAIEMLRRAADAEDILGKHPVSPGAFVPIREQLGTLLLEMGQPTKAQREFEAALKIYPGRFRGLYGAARAAEQAGDKENASRYYTKLAAQTANATGSRDELNHVREFLSAEAKATGPNNVSARQ